MSRRRYREGDSVADLQEELGIKELLGPGMTVVGRGAQLEGTLASAESIRIDGRAKGKITAAGDVILSSDSQVEADIKAQNVVMAGTLKGNITARTKTELAQGGRVEGRIRSKVLVVREGAVFSGQSNMPLEDAAGGEDGSACTEDDLMMAYEAAVRRAAEWYRLRLLGPADHERAGEPDVPRMPEPDEVDTSSGQLEPPLPPGDREEINGSPGGKSSYAQSPVPKSLV